MKKIVLIPDSFKGTMSSGEICEIMSKSIKNLYPDIEIASIPVADGGEGSVDAFLSAMGGEKKSVKVKGPMFEDVDAFFGVIDNGNTAIIEMAACAGLPLVDDNKDPRKTTTYGAGQIILEALNCGCRKIIMGLGGSATNDAGTGAAVALGVKFFNSKGEEFIPVGGTLSEIEKIDLSNINPALKETQIITMCDIDNPLYGESGAAFVFSPQKGATPEIVIELDNGLKHIANIIQKDIGIDVSEIKGGGAAGGMGAGMIAFFNSQLLMGIEAVLDTVNFDTIIKDADMVISGEGKIDDQSIRGKVVIGIAKRTKKVNVPLVAIVGDIGDNINAAYDMGVSAIFSINRVAVDFKIAKTRAKDDLQLTIDNLMRFIKTLKKKAK